MERTILHADVDAFFASVAQREDPRLRGRPVLVGGWVVMAASYEARAHGVSGGMRTAEARRRCPAAVVVDACWEANKAASTALFAIFRRRADVVEAGSMEEAFLHVPGPIGAGADLAAALRREVREELELPLSVGVARTKVLAKIASRSAKPDGCFVVAPDGEEAFLHPLPVERLWGVGPATAGRLHAHGLRTVGQAAVRTEAELMAILGKAAGRYVHAVAHRQEPRPLQRRRGRRSFGAQRALGSRPRARADLHAALDDLAERLAARMARRGRTGRTVVLRLRFGDYTHATRSCTLARPTGEAASIAAAGRELLDAAMGLVEHRGITLVGLTVTNLEAPAGGEQLALPLFGEAPPGPLPGGAWRRNVAVSDPHHREGAVVSSTVSDSELKGRHRAMWASGDYPTMVTTFLLPLGPRLVEACGIGPGMRVLDVAAGTGNASIPAAQAGARVTASDLTPELLEAGRRRAEGEGLELEWVTADAEHLPFEDASFDVVMSCIGAMFAPHHQEVADELVRVCRPGGTIGLLSWTPEGMIGALFRTMGPFAPPPPPGAQPAPLWGSEEHLAELFGDRVEMRTLERQDLEITAFERPRDYGRHFKTYYGPTIAARRNAAAHGREAEFDEALERFCDEWNRGTPERARFEKEYLLAVGTRT